MMPDAHDALIYTMVIAAASDGAMSDAELDRIGNMVKAWPVFRGYDPKRISDATRDCVEMMGGEDGLDIALDTIRDALPDHLRETAYAIAVDVIAVDGGTSQEELRLLELMRHRFGVERLPAAAIERSARARHMTL